MAKKEKEAPVDFDDQLSSKILEQLPTPVMAVDKDFKILHMNKAGCSFLGKKTEELVGKHCYNEINSKHCNTPECRMKQVLNGSKAVTVRNVINLGNRTIPIEYTADILKDEQGNIIGGLEYITDITETVRQEEKL